MHRKYHFCNRYLDLQAIQCTFTSMWMFDENPGVFVQEVRCSRIPSQIERIVLQEGPISFVGPGFYCHQEHGEFALDPKGLLRPLNK
jgi:hypothetical protein